MNQTPTKAGRLGRQVQRVLLLVTLVVGVAAAIWIWEHFRVEAFEVTVRAADDPFDTLAGEPYGAAEFLDHLELQAWAPSTGEPLALEPLDAPGAWRFKVGGEARRDARNARIRARLMWKDADNDDLSLELPAHTASDSLGRIDFTVTHRAIQRFYDQDVATELKVVDGKSNVALPDLRQRGKDVAAFEDRGGGVYRLALTARNLLDMQQQLADSITFDVVRGDQQPGGERLELTVPLAWFFTRGGGDRRVVDLDLVTGASALCPLVTDLQPVDVRQDRWPGQLTVSGEFLDRTRAARLRHHDGATIACVLGPARSDRLQLLVATAPPAGRYEVLLASEGCPEIMAGRVRVTSPWTPLSAIPLATTAPEQGSPLTLAWRAGDQRGDLAVEVSSSGGGEPWQTLGKVPATASRFDWTGVDREPGQYRVRLRPVDRDQAVASWDVTVAPPAEVLVVLYFADGSRDWSVSQAWVDGREITPEEWQTRSLARVELALGTYRWVAKGRDGQAYTGEFTVEPRHAFTEGASFDYIKLDRAVSRLRD